MNKRVDPDHVRFLAREGLVPGRYVIVGPNPEPHGKEVSLSPWAVWVIPVAPTDARLPASEGWFEEYNGSAADYQSVVEGPAV